MENIDEMYEYVNELIETYGSERVIFMLLMCIFNTYKHIAENDQDLYKKLESDQMIGMIIGWSLNLRKLGGKITSEYGMEKIITEGQKNTLKFLKERLNQKEVK